MKGNMKTKEKLTAMEISKLVYKENGKAEELLRTKCRWEQMSRLDVIENWGDPRDWED